MTQMSGPTHVYPLVNSREYKNTLTIQTTENYRDDGFLKIKTSPISCKGKSNTAVMDYGGELHAVNYELVYAPLLDYFDASSATFKKFPLEHRKNMLKMGLNKNYACLFNKSSQRLNNFTLKYFDYAEQIYPRKQLAINNLSEYDSLVSYPQVESQRKVHLETNSLGKSFPTHANFVNCLFSPWPVETFEIEFAVATSVTTHDGELMQMNYDDAYIDLTGLSNGPYNHVGSSSDYYNLTLGYKINYANRPDSVSPSSDIKPYRLYEDHVGPDVSSNPCMAVMAEYSIEEYVDSYLEGNSAIQSSLTLFGHDSSVAGKSLLGEISYTDEIFEFKDIHKQIDRF
jgi:hypothetical protein